MTRVTRSQVEDAFMSLLTEVSGRPATHSNDIGAFRLDTNTKYGGIVIERIGSHGITVHPFGVERLTPREFVKAATLAARVARWHRLYSLPSVEWGSESLNQFTQPVV